MIFDFDADGLNRNGVNRKIEFHPLDAKKMRHEGFAGNDESWGYFKHVGNRKYAISFNLSIPKDAPEAYTLDVLDDDFCQPYDYQHILRNNPDTLPALHVWIEVEEIMKQLAECGIVTGHVFGEYI